MTTLDIKPSNRKNKNKLFLFIRFYLVSFRLFLFVSIYKKILKLTHQIHNML